MKLPGVLLICAIMTEAVYDYCGSQSCSTPKGHTMCKYPLETLGCEGSRYGLTANERKVILDRHNMHRQTVARGEERPQPPASNMMKMRWHMEAARIAQRWANQCATNHDTCRSLENLESVGQNIAFHRLSIKPDFEGELVRMVDTWYTEVANVDTVNVDSLGDVDNIDGYTQLVWAETTAVGCGFLVKDAPSNERRLAILVCNYVPSGNYRHKPMYKRGRACSECPGTSKCSKRYPGLCTHEDDDAGRDPKDHKGKIFTGPSGKDYDDRSGRDCSEPEDMSYRRRAGDDAFSDKPSVFVLLCLLLCVCWFHDVLAG